MSKSFASAPSLWRDLIKEIHAPSGAVSIRLMEDSGHQELVVRIDPKYPSLRGKIPSMFQGLKTRVEVRTQGRLLA